VGSETGTFDRPRHDDIDAQQVVDLRRMLRGAGMLPATLNEDGDDAQKEQGGTRARPTIETTKVPGKARAEGGRSAAKAVFGALGPADEREGASERELVACADSRYGAELHRDARCRRPWLLGAGGRG